MINLRHIGNSGIRFMVLKTIKLDARRMRIEIEHSYIGIIELEKIVNSTNLLNRRVLPIPAGGLREELSPIYMWQEAMTLFELIDYLD